MPARLSFVIPAYNEEALIARCLGSIRREVPAADILVVDNGSTDNTAAVARFLGATIISEARKGITRARQAGLEAVDTSWVAFIDADNELPPGWYGELAPSLEQDDVVAISGPPIYKELSWASRTSTKAYYRVGSVLHKVLPMVQGGNLVVRREALLAAGGFDTDIDFYGEDTATAVRLNKQGRIVFNPKLGIWSSARRMKIEGFSRVGMRYAANYFWMWLAGRPLTRTYRDHRNSS